MCHIFGMQEIRQEEMFRSFGDSLMRKMDTFVCEIKEDLKEIKGDLKEIERNLEKRSRSKGD